MNRKHLKTLTLWQASPHSKPLIIRGARQVGKSFLVRDFCNSNQLNLLELNFEKTPSLRKLFVEGENQRTLSLLEAHFGRKIDATALLFLDEIQAAPEVLARLRYFYEDTPHVKVIAAGSLLEFALAEVAYSVPVGRVEYLHLGPMTFQEYLGALNETSLLSMVQAWRSSDSSTHIAEIFHDRLLQHVRDFSIVGGLPEAVLRFTNARDFLGVSQVQSAILETYQQDFSKYRKRIPQERLERVFTAIPSQVGKKWVHARLGENEKAASIAAALTALCQARVAHRVLHSDGNGVPLAAEERDNQAKLLFIDVGLMGNLLGLRIGDLLEPNSFERINAGAMAEQWIGQHLLELYPSSVSPKLHYWVREKAGSQAEIDYLLAQGPEVFPIEVKAGSSSRAKSLQVFLGEKKKSRFGIHFSTNPARFNRERNVLELPFYLIEELPRILSSFQEVGEVLS